MNALFHHERNVVDAMFVKSRKRSVLGALEGANYQASGYYRPEMQCLMFDRSDRYCQVCQDAIEMIINLYSRPAPAVNQQLTGARPQIR